MEKLFSAFVLCFLLIACGGKSDTPGDKSSPAKKEAAASAGSNKNAKATAKGNRKGKIIYKQYCVACHGADGKMALNGAKDLSISEIDMKERINQITNGKGMMTPYKDILSEEQIKNVAEYLDELIK